MESDGEGEKDKDRLSSKQVYIRVTGSTGAGALQLLQPMFR